MAGLVEGVVYGSQEEQNQQDALVKSIGEARVGVQIESSESSPAAVLAVPISAGVAAGVFNSELAYRDLMREFESLECGLSRLFMFQSLILFIVGGLAAVLLLHLRVGGL